MHNASRWLEETLSSVVEQTFTGSMELSVYDDASTVSCRAACAADLIREAVRTDCVKILYTL